VSTHGINKMGNHIWLNLAIVQGEDILKGKWNYEINWCWSIDREVAALPPDYLAIRW
jgi:hypothetical protein